MALPERFYVLASNANNTALERTGSFCSPECSAAVNAYLSKNANTDERAMRHRLLEQEFQRRIKPAPPRNMLFCYNRRTGLHRTQWLPQCRDQLSQDELEVVRLELALPKHDRIAFPQQKK
jgi:hypothetical protein